MFAQLVCACAAWLAVRIIARNKEEAVRRVIFACIMLGNAGNMPMLILQSLCDNFAPLRQQPNCLTTSAGVTSLFSLPFNIVLVRCQFVNLRLPSSSIQ